MNRTAPPIFALGLCLTTLFVMTGCNSGTPLLEIPRSNYLFGPLANRAAAEQLKSEIYPAKAELGDDLDIVVIRQGGNITVINRTPSSYENVQLWLNQQYVGQVATVNIGTNNRFQLDHFINSFGEGFPVGGLLTPDRSFPIVLAELYLPPTGEAGDPADTGNTGDKARNNAKAPDATTTDDAPPTNAPPKSTDDIIPTESQPIPYGRRHRLTVRDLDRHIMR